MQVSPEKRASAVTCRTDFSLQQDHRRFVEAGRNIKHAKLFHNVIREPLFSIPLEQV